jgi:uncharacterized membrane protein YozB (DUF420 family)
MLSGRAGTVPRKILFGILITVVLTILCVSAFALPAPPPGAGAGQFNQGIGIYWPYHVLLMSAGFVLLAAGFIIARYHKTANWYKTHKIFEAAGGACIVVGMVVGISMVAISGFPPLRNIHEIFGVITGLLVIVAIALGLCIKRAKESKNSIRVSHRWLGRITIGLMVLTIILGFLFLSIFLRR